VPPLDRTHHATHSAREHGGSESQRHFSYAFITEPSLVKRILGHIRKRDRASRGPPRFRSPVALPPAARPAWAPPRP